MKSVYFYALTCLNLPSCIVHFTDLKRISENEMQRLIFDEDWVYPNQLTKTLTKEETEASQLKYPFKFNEETNEWSYNLFEISKFAEKYYCVTYHDVENGIRHYAICYFEGARLITLPTMITIQKLRKDNQVMDYMERFKKAKGFERCLDMNTQCPLYVSDFAFLNTGNVLQAFRLSSLNELQMIVDDYLYTQLTNQSKLIVL